MWKQIQVHIMIKSVILPLTFQENRRQISSSLKMDNSSKPSQVSPLQRFPQFQDCAGDIPQGLVKVGCQDPRVDLQGGEREGPQHHCPRHVSSKDQKAIFQLSSAPKLYVQVC